MRSLTGAPGMASVDPEARALYDACVTIKPAWDQLGEATKGVWRQYAKLKLAGITDYYRLHYSWPHLDLANVSSLADIRMLASRASGVLRQPPLGVHMDLNHKQVADILDEIAGLYLKLSGSFRSAASGGGSAGVDGKAGSKPAAKSAGKPSKPAAKEADADTDTDPVELTEDDVREKLKELAGSKGKEKMVEALESVGAAKLADVDESQYNELVAKVDELLAEEDEPAPATAAKKAAAKKVAKKAGPTLDQVTEAAKALIDADKPAYLKISKKLGKPSEMDESVYAEAIAAYEAAMPADSDDDLI